MTDRAPLQMIRADINVRDFQRWMGSRQLGDADHAMHCLLTEVFGELAPRPFRALFPRGGGCGVLYGYAAAGADGLRDAAGRFACPLQSRIIPPGSLDSKPMPAQWPVGQRLGFEVRVRPVVRRSRRADRQDGGQDDGRSGGRPGRELDAFQYEAEQHPKGAMPRSREDVYHDWLAAQLRGRGGARLESAGLQSFRRTRAYRKRRTRYIEGPDALMRGELVITDGDAFTGLLAGGVGRHRAYGYGMLLLRPAGSPIRR